MRRALLILGPLLIIGGLLGFWVIGADDGESGGTGASSTTTDASAEDGGETTATTTSTTPPVAAYEPRFEESACQFNRPLGRRVECGYLVVPEDRSAPDGRQVRLHVAIFESDSATPAADPVVYLEGGPGGEPLESLEFGFDDRFGPFLEEREVVIFDQRGTGFSQPALSCPAHRELGFELLGEDIEPVEARDRELVVLESCRDGWVDQGIDLTQYNSVDSAADVADLRTALRYDEWNLYGISYGTRLALTVMRDHPEGIRSVILDSTYPPEADGIADFPSNARRGFDALFAGCAADPGCSEAYGDIETRLYGLVERLDADPLRIPVTDLLTGDRYEAVIAGDDLLGVFFQSLYSEQLIPSLPKLIADLEVGETGDLSQLVSIFLVNGEFISTGMHLSVQCHEEVTFADPAEVAASTDGLPYMSALVEGSILQAPIAFQFCDEWGAGTAEPIDGLPVDSEITTLVLAGAYDPITPPADGRAVAERLDNAYFFEFSDLGHGVSTAADCPLQITLAFLDEPATAPDASCIDELGNPAWILPGGGGGPAEVEMVPFEAAPAGLAITGVAPADWEDQGFGTYARLATGFDQTAMVIQGFPGEFGQLVLDGLVESLPLDDELEDLSPFDDGARQWQWLGGTTLGARIDILTLEEDGNTFMIVLLSDADERDQLLDSVLRPVAAALQAAS